MFSLIQEEADAIIGMANDVESASIDVKTLIGLDEVTTGDDPKAVVIYDIAMESIRDRLGITDKHLATEATALEHVKAILGKIKDFITAMVKKIVQFFKSIINWITGTEPPEEKKVSTTEVKKYLETNQDWANGVIDQMVADIRRSSFKVEIVKGSDNTSSRTENSSVYKETLSNLKNTEAVLEATSKSQQEMIKRNERFISDVKANIENREKVSSIIDDFNKGVDKIIKEATDSVKKDNSYSGDEKKIIIGIVESVNTADNKKEAKLVDTISANTEKLGNTVTDFAKEVEKGTVGSAEHLAENEKLLVKAIQIMQSDLATFSKYTTNNVKESLRSKHALRRAYVKIARNVKSNSDLALYSLDMVDDLLKIINNQHINTEKLMTDYDVLGYVGYIDSIKGGLAVIHIEAFFMSDSKKPENISVGTILYHRDTGTVKYKETSDRKSYGVVRRVIGEKSIRGIINKTNTDIMKKINSDGDKLDKFDLQSIMFFYAMPGDKPRFMLSPGINWKDLQSRTENTLVL